MTTRFERSVVRLYCDPGQSRPGAAVVGAGFLVDDRHVLTCQHVIEGCLTGAGMAPGDEVMLDFPFVTSPERTKLRAAIDFHRKDDHFDVAGLVLLDPAPDGAAPAKLVSADDYWEHPFRAPGFPAGGQDGTYAEGHMLAADARAWIQIQSESTIGRRVQRGFSGGPVYDTTLHGVAGIVVVADKSDTDRVAFMIPMNVLVHAWSSVLGDKVRKANPYCGLAALDEARTQHLHGRQQVVERSLAILDRGKVCVLTGSSGSGKSSVLQAGVLAAARRQGHSCLLVRGLGDDPFRALAESLVSLSDPRTDRPRSEIIKDLADAMASNGLDVDLRDRLKLTTSDTCVLLFDQFEEILTGEVDPLVRQTFLEHLSDLVETASPRVRVALTIRSDCLPRVRDDARLFDPERCEVVEVGALSRSALLSAIAEPAVSSGGSVEDGLTEEIADEIEGRPGCLPQLQFVLSTMWDSAVQGHMTRSDYTRAGGVHGALAAAADAAFAGLKPAEQTACKRVFVQLVHPNSGEKGLRRPVAESDLLPGDWAVVDVLAEERLVAIDLDATGQRTVLIAHEALVEAWPRLSTWVETTCGELDAMDALADEVIGRAVRQAALTSTIVPFVMLPILLKLSRNLADVYRMPSDKESQKEVNRRLLRNLVGFYGGSVVAIQFALRSNPVTYAFVAAGQASAAAVVTRAAGSAWKHHFRLRYIGAADVGARSVDKVFASEMRRFVPRGIKRRSARHRGAQRPKA